MKRSEKLDAILNNKWYECESEYNLTIQQVMQKENIGNYYKNDYLDVIFCLTKNEELDTLELIAVHSNHGIIEKGDLIEEVVTLNDILNLNFKEVQCLC